MQRKHLCFCAFVATKKLCVSAPLREISFSNFRQLLHSLIQSPTFFMSLNRGKQ